MKNIVIVGGARDYHVVDWYRSVKKSVGENRKVVLLTDLTGGEGFENIIDESIEVKKLFIIDRLLFKKQSRTGDIWRNIIKLILIPLQAFLLKKYFKKNPDSVFHGQPMYYMFLCMIAGVEYCGTPQGSEILVRPNRSRLYKIFAKKALQNAKTVSVDSENMKKGIKEISGVEAVIVQNGIEIEKIGKYSHNSIKREKITSIRAFTSLYRISEIIKQRNDSAPALPINFIYPFYDENYRLKLREMLRPFDVEHGRLKKDEMFKLLSETLLTISIPESDSSPRSVYEAIFSGSFVATVKNGWIDALPECMKERLFIVDIEDDSWLNKALDFAQKNAQRKFVPSEKAVDLFDQYRSVGKAIEMLYE